MKALNAPSFPGVNARPEATSFEPHKIRIRSVQAVLTEGGTRLVWSGMRIGDFAAAMICAKYKRLFEHKHVTVEVTLPLLKSLRPELLFRDAAQSFTNQECPELEVYDPGALWVMAPYYVRRYGAAVLPQLEFGDESLPLGLSRGDYIVFAPLADAAYNPSRNMSPSLISTLTQRLAAGCGRRLVVVSRQTTSLPRGTVGFQSESLLDIARLIGGAAAYIGGDTGFTHLAGLSRVPRVFGLYGDNCHIPQYLLEREGFCRPFAAQGQWMREPWVTRPNVDPSATSLTVLQLRAGNLADAEIGKLVAGVHA